MVFFRVFNNHKRLLIIPVCIPIIITSTLNRIQLHLLRFDIITTFSEIFPSQNKVLLFWLELLGAFHNYFWMRFFSSFIAFSSFSHSPIDSWAGFSCLSFPLSSSLRSSMDSWLASNSLSLDSSSVSCCVYSSLDFMELLLFWFNFLAQCFTCCRAESNFSSFCWSFAESSLIESSINLNSVSYYLSSAECF